MDRNPFSLTSQTVQEHAFSLLAALFGMEEVWKLTPPSGHHEVFSDLHSEGTEQFQKHMMSLAMLARIKDQGMNTLAEHIEKNPAGVGDLTQGDATIPLTAREACNKVIHAQSAIIEWEDVSDHPIYHDIYLEKYGENDEKLRHPFIILEGKHHKKEWNAKINVVRWVHAVTAFTV